MTKHFYTLLAATCITTIKGDVNASQTNKRYVVTP